MPFHRALALLLVFATGGLVLPALHEVAHALEDSPAPREVVAGVYADEYACALCEARIVAVTEASHLPASASAVEIPPVLRPAAPDVVVPCPVFGRAPPVSA